MTPLFRYLKRLEVFGKTPVERLAGKYGNARVRQEIFDRMPESPLQQIKAAAAKEKSQADRVELITHQMLGSVSHHDLVSDLYHNLAAKFRGDIQ